MARSRVSKRTAQLSYLAKSGKERASQFSVGCVAVKHRSHMHRLGGLVTGLTASESNMRAAWR
jgi:hypothetical protein